MKKIKKIKFMLIFENRIIILKIMMLIPSQFSILIFINYYKFVYLISCDGLIYVKLVYIIVKMIKFN